MTDAERKLWYYLRANRFEGIKFVRQKPIGPYVVDFCCYGGKLVVELDGGQHYQQIERDTRRTVFLIKEGYRVIRFSDTDALKNTIAVLEQIRRALYDRHALPSPQPSPASGDCVATLFIRNFTRSLSDFSHSPSFVKGAGGI